MTCHSGHLLELKRVPVANRSCLTNVSPQADFSIIVRSFGIVQIECNLFEAYPRLLIGEPQKKDRTRPMSMQQFTYACLCPTIRCRQYGCDYLTSAPSGE